MHVYTLVPRQAMMGLGCGLVVSVSVRAFYSEDPNSNPAELYIVFCIII